MIESTALCLAVAYLALVHRATRPEKTAARSPVFSVRVPLLIAAAGIGALAGAVKVTTLVAFMTTAAVLVALRWRRSAWPRRTTAA